MSECFWTGLIKASQQCADLTADYRALLFGRNSSSDSVAEITNDGGNTFTEVYDAADNGDLPWNRLAGAVTDGAGTVLIFPQGANASGHRLLRSTDNGQTYSLLTPSATVPQVDGYQTSQITHFNSQFHALDNVKETYWVSSDGATWVEKGAIPDGGFVGFTGVAELGGNLYVGVDNGIYESTDGGDTWINVKANGSGFECYYATLISTGTALLLMDNAYYKVWRSTNGTDWTEVLNVGLYGGWPGLAIGNGLVLAVAGSGKVFTSDDDGASFTLTADLAINSVGSVDFLGGIFLVAFNSDNSIHATTDGFTFASAAGTPASLRSAGYGLESAILLPKL